MGGSNQVVQNVPENSFFEISVFSSSVGNVLFQGIVLVFVENSDSLIVLFGGYNLHEFGVEEEQVVAVVGDLVFQRMLVFGFQRN